MKNFLLVVLCLFVFSCSQKDNQSATAEKKKGLDLEKIDFKEQPLEILKSKIDTDGFNDHSMIKKGYAELFDYPINHKLDPWNGKESLYGKAYYSKLEDSIAYYKNINFNRIAFLTHDNKTVAILANAEIKSDTVYNELVKQLTKQFGEPSFSPTTTTDVCHEWTDRDRFIQIDYFTGASMTAMSGKGMEIKKTFDLQMLIFRKDAAMEINKIQKTNYEKTKSYKVMQGDFKLFKSDPQKNTVLGDSLLNEKFK